METALIYQPTTSNLIKHIIPHVHNSANKTEFSQEPPHRIYLPLLRFSETFSTFPACPKGHGTFIDGGSVRFGYLSEVQGRRQYIDDLDCSKKRVSAKKSPIGSSDKRVCRRVPVGFFVYVRRTFLNKPNLNSNVIFLSGTEL